jgi:hypothetical protein
MRISLEQKRIGKDAAGGESSCARIGNHAGGHALLVEAGNLVEEGTDFPGAIVEICRDAFDRSAADAKRPGRCCRSNPQQP